MSFPRVRAALRLLIIPLIVAVTILVAWRLGYFELDRRQTLLDTVQRLRQMPSIEVGYIAVFTVAVALCLPANIGTMLAGAIFGTWIGAGISLVGGLLSTALAYWLARTIARRPVKRLFGQHRLLKMLKDHDGIVELAQLRVIPVAPFAVLAYVAGVSGASLRNLLIATVIGAIAGSVAYSFAGAALLEGIVSSSDASRRAFIIAGSVTAAMLLLSFVAGIVRKRRD